MCSETAAIRGCLYASSLPKHKEAVIQYHQLVNHLDTQCIMELKTYSLKQQYKTL